MLHIPLINLKNLSIAKNIRLTLAIGLVISCLLVTIISFTSWQALKTINEKLENSFSSRTKTDYIYDMRIAARERNMHLMKMLISVDPFDIDDEWIAFRNQGSIFLSAREEYLALNLDEEEKRILKKQRELSVVSVALQYEMYELKLKGDVDGAIEKLNRHLDIQESVFSVLDELLSHQKYINNIDVVKARLTKEKSTKKVMGLSLVVEVIIIFMMSYMIQRLSRQAIDLENEGVKFKALIEGSMDAVLVLEESRIIDCNVNALNMFGVNSLKEFNDIGFDYFSCFSDTKSSHNSDEIFSVVNNVLVDVKRRYQWIFIDNEGVKFPADVELTGVNIEGNKYVQIVIRDVTDREDDQRKLQEANDNLEQKVQDRTFELKELNIKMVDIARSAGMAEVASGVLHNVGNVLNSVNVSTSIIKDKIRDDRLDNLDKLAVMLVENKDNLADFLTNDERGKFVIPYIEQLSKKIKLNKKTQMKEIEELVTNVDHIKNIISMQQTYSGNMGVIDKIKASSVCEDAININKSSIQKNGISLIRSYRDDPVISVDKHKLIQILVNLISNAKYAVINGGKVEKIIIVKIKKFDDNIVYSVEDNGIGIDEKDLKRIFEFGFKKRIGGHGYGLHHSSLMAKELGGDVSVESPGEGEGAIFRLAIPI